MWSLRRFLFAFAKKYLSIFASLLIWTFRATFFLVKKLQNKVRRHYNSECNIKINFHNKYVINENASAQSKVKHKNNRPDSSPCCPDLWLLHGAVIRFIFLLSLCILPKPELSAHPKLTTVNHFLWAFFSGRTTAWRSKGQGGRFHTPSSENCLWVDL